MSEQKVEKITRSLANAITKSTELIVKHHSELSETEAFEIKIKAITNALLTIIEMSDFSPVQLATNSKNWLAIGQINVGGESIAATSTKELLNTIQNKVLKHESCGCEFCQGDIDPEQIEQALSEAFGKSRKSNQSSINEQTAKEILQEIESETIH